MKTIEIKFFPTFLSIVDILGHETTGLQVSTYENQIKIDYTIKWDFGLMITSLITFRPARG